MLEVNLRGELITRRRMAYKNRVEVSSLASNRTRELELDRFQVKSGDVDVV